jgi:hypothetical protein
MKEYTPIKTSSAKNWVFLDNCCFETKLYTIADTYPPGRRIMTTSNEFIVYLFLLYFYRMFYKINELSFVWSLILNIFC